MNHDHRTTTPVLADAMDMLAGDIQSHDGIANATIAEAAMRLRELMAMLQKLRSDRDCEKRMRKDAEERREELSEEAPRLRAALQQIADSDGLSDTQAMARVALDHVPDAGKKVGA